MTSLIQNLARLAQQTFSKQVNEESLNRLRNLASNLTARDVDFKGDLLEDQKNCGLKGPTVHVDICEDDFHSISIFGIREGKKIPLHDHPDMYGLIKVIRGAIKIKSFTQLSVKEISTTPKEITSKVSWRQRHLLIPTVMTGEKIVTQSNESCLLYPNENNIHEITSIEGLSAFVDILSPPYQDGERDCHFYTVLGTAFDPKLNVNVTWLLQIDSPSSYWCDTIPYSGPPVRL
ncbi:2-aminoethanethiol dioxygenase-like [Panonychus citri]|uniref:2-aminoethanethiol dioxygenase-like n=1 Tax=Panonychus citri TaxID=50023 RepID=UPI0023079CF5|nr:2-aminoethanethiol dioxygenase-like [Panonychus citri]XP_053214818.1 2-aminoethanethiol dioxygenase-like [Panonychus citri]